jgi:hypothetical protein
MRQIVLLLIALLFSASVGAQSAEPRLAGATQRTCTQSEIQQALAGEYIGSPCRFSNLPEQSAQRAAIRVSESSGRSVAETTISSRGQSLRSGSRNTLSYRSASAERPRENTAITLPETFFSGPSSGGVERRSAPLYSYRGLILISADGRVSYGSSLLAHRSNIVRAMDRVGPNPPRSKAPQRVYPAY